MAIHRKEKDGDWYIYLSCFAHENSERAYRNTKKYCKSFKLDKSNAVSVGTTAIKPYLSICLVGLVWFAMYCGKMYSRHLFAYGGLRHQNRNSPRSLCEHARLFEPRGFVDERLDNGGLIKITAQDLSVQIVFFTFSCKWFLCFYFWPVIWSYLVDQKHITPKRLTSVYMLGTMLLGFFI